jgi:hypothetical protein
MTDVADTKTAKEYKSTPTARKIATEYYHNNKERLIQRRKEERLMLKKMNCEGKAEYIFLKFQKMDRDKAEFGLLDRFDLKTFQTDSELKGKILKMVEEAIGDKKDFKIINEVFRVFDVDLLGK